ncbi:MAG: phosphotransferase family protein [Steroidobacteraceae bacterium]
MSTQLQPPASPATSDDREWITEQVGNIVRFDRLPGGGQRLTWLLDVQPKHGGPAQLILQRVGFGPYVGTPLADFEWQSAVLRELGAAGVAVPGVVALSPDGNAMLSTRIAGSSEFDALADTRQRRAVARSFLAELAKLHRVDATKLKLPARVRMPRSCREAALAWVELWQQLFDSKVQRPAPVVRIALQWLKAHAPEAEGHLTICWGDVGPGNFLFEGDQCTALLDWELTHIGDPHDDLGILALRAYQMSDFGDINADLTLYEQLSGMPVDRQRVKYYRLASLVMGTVTSLIQLDREVAGRVAMPLYLHLVPYLQWLIAQALMDLMGLKPEEIAIPPARVSAPELEIVHTLREEVQNAGAAAHRVQGIDDLLAHLEARAHIGNAVDTAELDDIERLLGSRPPTIREGIQALDRRLQQSQLDMGELVRFTYRSTVRQSSLWPAWAQRYRTPLTRIG